MRQQTFQEWIHLERKKGGLGIPDALEMTYLAKERLVEQMKNSKDGNVRSVLDAGLWGSEIHMLRRNLSSQRGLDPSMRLTLLSAFRWQRWCQPIQGRGAEAFVSQRINW